MRLKQKEILVITIYILTYCYERFKDFNQWCKEQTYGYGVDWWSFATVLFEMAKGSTRSLDKGIPQSEARKIRKSRFHLPFGSYMMSNNNREGNVKNQVYHAKTVNYDGLQKPLADLLDLFFAKDRRFKACY